MKKIDLKSKQAHMWISEQSTWSKIEVILTINTKTVITYSCRHGVIIVNICVRFSNSDIYYFINLDLIINISNYFNMFTLKIHIIRKSPLFPIRYMINLYFVSLGSWMY